MISVLLPTRSRPKMLREAVESVWNTVSDPSNVEIICRFDNDDPMLVEALERLIGIRVSRILTSARHGYANLQHYFNEMALKAQGDWLLLFGDDCIIKTSNWDKEVLTYDHTKYIHLVGTTDVSDHPCFPLISRAAYEKIGCFSNNNFNDTWLMMLFRNWKGAEMHSINMHILNRELVKNKHCTEEMAQALYDDAIAWAKRLA